MSRRDFTQKSFNEGFDRNGHWSREFSLRGEGWSVIEHWAGEHRFGLVHFKGKRRIYRLGDNPKLFVTFVEIRLAEEENRLSISCWIEAGFLVRLLSLFMIPIVLDVSPSGFWGIRARRAACHAMNSLLVRMKQPLVLGSTGWHWADLDLTTITLGASALGTFVSFALASATLIRIETGLSQGLLQIVGEHLVTLCGLTVAALAVQQFFVVRRWSEGPSRLLSAGSLYIAILVSTIFLFTQSRTETSLMRISHFCLQNYHDVECAHALDRLPPQARRKLMDRVFQLEDSIARRENLAPSVSDVSSTTK